MSFDYKFAEVIEGSTTVINTDFPPACGLIFSYGKTSNSLTPNANCLHCVGFFAANGQVCGSFRDEDNLATTQLGVSSRGSDGGESLTTAAGLAASDGRIDTITLGASSVTLSWSDTAGGAERYQFLIFGGPAMNSYVASWTPPASAGRVSISAPGFRGALAFFHTVHGNNADDDTMSGILPIDYSFGCATANGQWVLGVQSLDNSAGSVTQRWQLTDRCFAQHSSTGVVQVDARFEAFHATGFDLTVVDTAGYQPRVHYLVIGGTNAFTHTFNCPTTAIPQTLTGMPFQPQLHLFASFAAAASATDLTNAFIMLGYAGSPTNVGWAAMLMRTSSNPTVTDSGGACVNPGSICFRIYTYSPAGNVTLRESATFTGNNADGCTLDWVQASGVAKQICGVALGDGPTCIIGQSTIPGVIIP